MLEALILAIEYKIYDLLGKAIIYLTEWWMNHAESFNPGQLVIYANYLEYGVVQSCEDMTANWPYYFVAWYEETMYTSYWIDVLDRAFSDTILGPSDHIQELADRAMELQAKKELLELIAAFL